MLSRAVVRAARPSCACAYVTRCTCVRSERCEIMFRELVVTILPGDRSRVVCTAALCAVVVLCVHVYACGAVLCRVSTRCQL